MYDNNQLSLLIKGGLFDIFYENRSTLTSKKTLKVTNFKLQMVFVMMTTSVLSQDLFQGILQESSVSPVSDYDI